MTLGKLIKNLQILEKKHGKRAHVCFNVEAINNNHNPDYSHSNLENIEVEVIVWAKDDNIFLANGQERTRLVVTLS